jgi:Transcriptional regulator PadR-like family
MGVFKRWRETRLADDSTTVLSALWKLRPEQASALPISRLAGLSAARTYVVLARLEDDGAVWSEWAAHGPDRRHRLYRLTADMPEVLR